MIMVALLTVALPTDTLPTHALLVENKLHLLGDEWENFARDNLNSSVRTLHFVKEGDDTFYITRFNRDGIEWQGYDQLVIGDFLQDIWKNTFKIYINRTMSNRLLLALFRNNGTCMHDGIVFPLMLMLPARTIPSYATVLVEYFVAHELDKYKKAVLAHDDVRYTMALKLIADRIRPRMRSHVKMMGNWKVFGTMCDFELPKMLRFKLAEKVKDVEGVNMEMPLFHVC
ncbi:hypothetical protein Tco_1499418 [Tanacetum coccineum]